MKDGNSEKKFIYRSNSQQKQEHNLPLNLRESPSKIAIELMLNPEVVKLMNKHTSPLLLNSTHSSVVEFLIRDPLPVWASHPKDFGDDGLSSHGKYNEEDAEVEIHDDDDYENAVNAEIDENDIVECYVSFWVENGMTPEMVRIQASSYQFHPNAFEVALAKLESLIKHA